MYLYLVRMLAVCFQVYCLPDNYEVVDRSLDDIRAVLNPHFTTQVRVLLSACLFLKSNAHLAWEGARGGGIVKLHFFYK